MAIRSVICTVMGHVDHGKSSILDTIRGSAIVKSEPGQITQAIGASIIPIGTISRVCGSLMDMIKGGVTIPGLLFIDTPGHAAFSHLRKRGGNLADIAIVVVDVNEGIKPQTIEAVGILRSYKTPFVVAANKIDLISGWRPSREFLIKNINEQPDNARQELDKKLYSLVEQFSNLGFASERFDRLESYMKQVAIIPCSAKTNEGIPELLMVITGLAQRFLENSLEFLPDNPAKGTILEVKKEKGIGTTIDVILYDGSLEKNDVIVIGTLGKPIVTRVKALFEPAPLQEMRDKKAKFIPIQKAIAATGVKIAANDIDGAIAGMPLRESFEDLELIEGEIKKEVGEVIIEGDSDGIVVKADTLGSLEAMVRMLREKNVAIRTGSIGNITKKDISDAETNYGKDMLKAVILGFNVSLSSDVSEVGQKVKIITGNVIYNVIGDFEAWMAEESGRKDREKMEAVAKPCKVQLLRGYVFRQSNPAIIGAEVLSGTLEAGAQLMKSGKTITVVKEIQLEGETINQAEKGKQVAVSLDRVSVGRQVNEGDFLYSFITEEDFRKLKQLKGKLSEDEINLLKEIAEIMRKENPMWGV